MATLTSLNPADMSELDTLEEVSFAVIEALGQEIVSVVVKYAGDDDEEVVWNGVEFLSPFALNSVLLKPLGDETNLYFRIRPELGWRGNVSEFKVTGIPAIS